MSCFLVSAHVGYCLPVSYILPVFTIIIIDYNRFDPVSYGFGGVATCKVPTVIPWAGVEPLLSPEGVGLSCNSSPKTALGRG